MARPVRAINRAIDRGYFDAHDVDGKFKKSWINVSASKGNETIYIAVFEGVEPGSAAAGDFFDVAAAKLLIKELRMAIKVAEDK